MWFLRCQDDFAVLVAQAVADRHLELMQTMDRNRAVMIANEVGRVFGGN